MIPPPPPVDETARLRSLRSLGILDTPPEERFDRVTRMARRVFGVETCLVSLVDDHRQWFKSRQGMEACETPREISFCGHAILRPGIMVVNDARADERFVDNPLVTGPPSIRFYAGCPIREPSGYAVGTLCLIDGSPRDFSAEDGEMLRDLAALIEDELVVSARATEDELTRIANRRGFNIVTEHMLALCRRTGSPAELLLFDLDNFKEVNDELGHNSGDRILQHFAELLTKCFRSADVIARIGGDEFAVLMTASDPRSDAALERLGSLAADEQCELLGRLAWSVGRIQFDPDAHTSMESLMHSCDSLMYEDKLRHRSAG